MHNFEISVLDTDSLTVNKPNGLAFTQDEIDKLTEEINQISDELIKWEFEFYIPKLIVIKSKNYIMYDGKKIKTKGSSIRDQKKEPALLEMMNKLINALIFDKQDTLVDIYHSYIKEAMNVQDIKRWAQKKTVTESVLECKEWTQEQVDSKELRKNECDVWDAIKDEELVQQGDKLYVYPLILGYKTIPGGISEKTGKPLKDKVKEINGLRLTKYWNKDHDVEKLIERVYATLCIFESVIDITQFIDYNSKKNKTLLENLK